MRAIQIARHGGPEVLSVREVPQPTPGAGEVLIRTVASSLNPVDWKTRAGEIGPELPATLGWDLAGVVTAANHPGYRPGDQVIAMSAQIATGRGTWAEQVALPARLLAAAPATLPLADAAPLPLAGVRKASGHPSNSPNNSCCSAMSSLTDTGARCPRGRGQPSSSRTGSANGPRPAPGRVWSISCRSRRLPTG
ncbi:alcohol dehydrogenase catalytic domain-containing protein [Streptomyces sp. NPDC001552]|uniref:alcohol dehydrogenase catalytic domain-containing protein n=1 Tax=Streptomyces sp. NPDC001552 TaxID=3364587 RepID=UPI0036BF150C